MAADRPPPRRPDGRPDWLPPVPRRRYPDTLKVVLIVVVLLIVLVSCTALLAVVAAP